MNHGECFFPHNSCNNWIEKKNDQEATIGNNNEEKSAKNRYKMLVKNNPEVAKQLADELQKEIDARYAFYTDMAAKANA